jgi:hypothetical protein
MHGVISRPNGSQVRPGLASLRAQSRSCTASVSLYALPSLRSEAVRKYSRDCRTSECRVQQRSPSKFCNFPARVLSHPALEYRRFSRRVLRDHETSYSAFHESFRILHVYPYEYSLVTLLWEREGQDIRLFGLAPYNLSPTSLRHHTLCRPHYLSLLRRQS